MKVTIKIRCYYFIKQCTNNFYKTPVFENVIFSVIHTTTVLLRHTVYYGPNDLTSIETLQTLNLLKLLFTLLFASSITV